MRASTAYFAGAGTVVVAIAVGLGGGLLMANIMNPQTREASRLEQRHTSQQAEQSSTPAPYLAATQQAATTPVVISPARSSSPAPQNDASSAPAPTANAAAAEGAKPEKTEKTASGDAARKPVESSTPAAHEQGSSPENAYAKAREADVKRSADEKRKADRAERRHKWAARRHQQREQEPREVEAQLSQDQDNEPGRNIIVRRDDSGRDHSWRDDSDRPMRMDFPRFIFGQD